MRQAVAERQNSERGRYRLPYRVGNAIGAEAAKIASGGGPPTSMRQPVLDRFDLSG
jgi:hypothetical protein